MDAIRSVKGHECLTLIKSAQENVKQQKAADVEIMKLEGIIFGGIVPDLLLAILPILAPLIATALESYVRSVMNNSDNKDSTLSVTNIKSCGAFLKLHIAMWGAVYRESRSTVHKTKAKYGKLIHGQQASIGRLLFCCIVLMEHMKKQSFSVQNGIKTSKDKDIVLRMVSMNEFILHLLSSLDSCIHMWSSSILSLLPDSESATTCLPKSLTGAFLAQMIDLLLFFSSKLQPFTLPEVKRIAINSLSILNSLYGIVGCVRDGASSTSGTGGDPGTWRTYLPGLYSGLQSVCMDKSHQR